MISMKPVSLRPHLLSLPAFRYAGVALAVLLLLSLLTWQPLAAGELAEGAQPVAEPPIVRFIGADGHEDIQPLQLATTLRYSSYLGGNGVDEGQAIAVDDSGNIFVAGKTGSGDFLDSTTDPAGHSDLFVAKFSPTGTSLLYLTIIGSTDSDAVNDLQVDGTGNAFVSVWTPSDTFPTRNPLWPAPPEFRHNSVLFKLNDSGGLVYSTYLPLDVSEARHNLAVDAAGNAFLTGFAFVQEGDVFFASQMILLKLNPDGSQLLLHRHIGGDGIEKGIAVAVDEAGMIYLTGTTGDNASFPVTANAHQPTCGDVFYDPTTFCFGDGIVVVLNPAGEVTYSSYHGGSFSDEPQAIATDGKGHILIAGNTMSGHFPTVNALQDSCPTDPAMEDCSSSHGFVSLIKLEDGSATLVYSTYLGSTERGSTNVV